MKKDLTELVFILDKSGSMNGLEKDTIGGFNSMLKKQRKEKGECLVTTILFSHDYRIIHDRIDIKKVEDLTEEQYVPSGSTALIDAIGRTVQHIKEVHKYIREEDVPKNTLFVIITDGLENASVLFSSDQVKQMISEQKKEGWEFMFLGANIDAVETAKSFGIKEDRAVNYCSDAAGTALNYQVMGEAISGLRKNESIANDWSAKINADYKKRHK